MIPKTISKVLIALILNKYRYSDTNHYNIITHTPVHHLMSKEQQKTKHFSASAASVMIFQAEVLVGGDDGSFATKRVRSCDFRWTTAGDDLTACHNNRRENNTTTDLNRNGHDLKNHSNRIDSGGWQHRVKARNSRIMKLKIIICFYSYCFAGVGVIVQSSTVNITYKTCTTTDGVIHGESIWVSYLYIYICVID